MASPSCNPDVTLEVREEYPYPYPSNVYTPSFVTVKLNGKDKYGIWKTQILCLLESHGMLGFIDGTHVNPQTSVTGKEKVGDHETRQGLWRRSDALVKGWILGSLSEETFRCVLNSLAGKSHQQIDGDFSAKDVWDELQTMYGPPPQLQTVYGPVGLPQRALDKLEDELRARIHQLFYTALLKVRSDEIDRILGNKEVTVIDKITNNGNTALHVAVGATRKSELLQKLLELTPKNTQLLDLRNSDGSTLLHVAAIVGNTQAADILIARNPELLFAKDNEGHTPLAIAPSNMHTETAQHLLQHIDSDHQQKGALFSGASGDELLVTAISSKAFRLALDLLPRYKTLDSDAVLMAIALNFPRELTMLEEFSRTGKLHWKMESALATASDYTVRKCGTRVGKIISKFYVGFYWIIKLLPLILKMLRWPYIKERIRTHNDTTLMFAPVCNMIRLKHDSMSYNQYYMKPLFEAIRQNTHEVVKYIVFYFPEALSSANEEGHNIIQHAVINRSENIYNILYEMSEHKNVYRTIKDPSGNNLLHLAARLAPSSKLNLISGAALQIQRELQWFKEVEGFVCPLNIIQKNSFDETPQMVFTREHKELVIEGEKWMKATAESYTITAALIITIVFAAAITVPGGNNQDSGLPIFTNNAAFTVFAISDAISLFAAVTSLLTFLSVLTTRFAEQDFLFKLPTKLIIGLATLFISTTSMIVAFGATLYIVFGQGNSRILISIAVLTCLPITSFVTLQFPLVIELMNATYGRSIFGKRGINISFQ
ncbi:hypothetical protein LXL04_027896 [Taraxacum kok-saghyz]